MNNCIICTKNNSGINIYGLKICLECEKKVINTDLSTDFYKFYSKCIKNRLVKNYLVR